MALVPFQYRIERYQGSSLLNPVARTEKIRAIEKRPSQDKTQDKKQQESNFEEQSHSFIEDSLGRYQKVSHKQHKVIISRPAHILVAWDDSEQSQQTLSFGIQLSLKYKSKLTVVHIFSEENETTKNQIRAKIEQDILRVIQEPSQTLVLVNDSIQIKLIQSNTKAQTLIEQIVQFDSSLICLGAQKKNQLEKWLWGSTVIEILEKSPCPILLSHKESTHSEIQKIMVPVEEKHFSFPAIYQAIALSNQFKAELILFHVDHEQQSFDNTEFLALINKMQWQQSEHSFVHQQSDNVAQTIKEFCSQENIDLVIMPAHHHNDAQQQNSISTQLSFELECHLWILHPHE